MVSSCMPPESVMASLVIADETHELVVSQWLRKADALLLLKTRDQAEILEPSARARMHGKYERQALAIPGSRCRLFVLS